MHLFLFHYSVTDTDMTKDHNLAMKTAFSENVTYWFVSYWQDFLPDFS